MRDMRRDDGLFLMRAPMIFAGAALARAVSDFEKLQKSRASKASNFTETPKAQVIKPKPDESRQVLRAKARAARKRSKP